MQNNNPTETNVIHIKFCLWLCGGNLTFIHRTHFECPHEPSERRSGGKWQDRYVHWPRIVILFDFVCRPSVIGRNVLICLHKGAPSVNVEERITYACTVMLLFSVKSVIREMREAEEVTDCVRGVSQTFVAYLSYLSSTLRWPYRRPCNVPYISKREWY